VNGRELKVAVVAGEVSGDLLAADLMHYLRAEHGGTIELVGVGGDALEAQGLRSFFDYSELSIMGITQVLKRLPQLLRRIRQTADRIVEARPDLLVIVDSPDFTHRVAKHVRAKLPGLPIVNYVCPSVWAWKEYRAQAMLGYVDHVLAVLPFEPQEMVRLGGPKTTFIGHRLTADPNVKRVREQRQILAENQVTGHGSGPCVLLLPGSRSTEIKGLMPILKDTADLIRSRNPSATFLLPTVSRQHALVESLLAGWSVKPTVTRTPQEKWDAFAKADMALAASGTVTLELALCGVPTVSMYKTDLLMQLFLSRIKVWSAALPNLIADKPVIPEHLNDLLRPGYFARWAEVLSRDTPQLRAMQSGFDEVWAKLATDTPPGLAGARVVLDLLAKQNKLPV
jgi:lipid-A-disaccharide synthase